MGKLIKADFYKILHTKYFYICAALSALMAVLSVYAYNITVLESYGIYASFLNLNSSKAILEGLPAFGTFLTIVISLFIPSDFSYGTIKNTIASGANRISIYFSKMTVSLTMLLIYAFICCAASFTTGSIIWEVGEYTREIYIDLLQSISFYLFAYLALVSFYIMVGFLVRRSGITIAINIGIPLVELVLFKFINYALVTWLKIEDFTFSDYLPSTYVSKALNFSTLTSQEINTGLIVCGAWILVTTIIGIITFKCRDIK